MRTYSDLLPIDAEFHLRVRQAVLAAQQSMRQAAVLVVSVDPAGDSSTAPLELVAQKRRLILMRLRSKLRDSDAAGEIANGRIGVLLHAIGNRDDIDKILKRLLGRLEEWTQTAAREVKLATHVGVALFPEHSDQANELLARAEEARARAAAEQRLYAIYSSSGDAGINDRQWMTQLRQAIVSDQLFLLYQPKVNLSNGGITGVEVLTRWQHPQAGIITPDKFIPIAERTGLIIPMTLWVLQRALQQCRRWRDRGINLSVAVNLTMWNLETQELPMQIESLLRDIGVAPANLELELTESAIMSDPERALHTLTQIQKLGVGFAIDDFGTGYSSFAYLKKLPVASLKIDKSFVFNIENDHDNSVIVGSIADLAHRLGLKVVAEGVETQACQELLASLNCDEAQGYHFSRPLPPAAVRQILTQRTSPADPPQGTGLSNAAPYLSAAGQNRQAMNRGSRNGADARLDIETVPAHNTAKVIPLNKRRKESSL